MSGPRGTLESNLPDNEQRALGIDTVRNRYKGFPLADCGWQHPSHNREQRQDSFYVRSPDGTYGWVPWLGSQIVWPWEAAWEQDLYDDATVSFIASKMTKPKGQS